MSSPHERPARSPPWSFGAALTDSVAECGTWGNATTLPGELRPGHRSWIVAAVSARPPPVQFVVPTGVGTPRPTRRRRYAHDSLSMRWRPSRAVSTRRGECLPWKPAGDDSPQGGSPRNLDRATGHREPPTANDAYVLSGLRPATPASPCVGSPAVSGGEDVTTPP